MTLTLQEDLVIIGGNKETIITMKKLPLDIYGDFIAVLDSAQPNRVFVGHILEPDSFGNVHGGIVYFDAHGKHHNEIKILNGCLFSNYYKYGHPRTWCTWSKSIPNRPSLVFYRDSLAFLPWNSVGGAKLHIVRLKEDQVFSTHELHDELAAQMIINCHNRWISVYYRDLKIISFDITSFRSSSIEKKKTILYDAVILPETAKDTLIETLSSLSTPCYDHTERDQGYPMKCIKCRGNTVRGCNVKDYSTVLSLGKSFCTTCMIRYSETNKYWQCAKPAKSGPFPGYCCWEKVEGPNNYFCDKEHLTESEYELVYKTTPEDVTRYNKLAEVNIVVNMRK
jgi:hypothetical protein